MEKDIEKIPKNPETDIVIRVDDFGGKPGLTIREFVKSDRYTGFTKSGTRIPAEHFKKFKNAINSINEKDLVSSEAPKQESLGYNPDSEPKDKAKKVESTKAKNIESSQDSDSEEQTM
jgi:hypothetical protein